MIGDDGFLDTGDMGYWLDGEIVITGRVKDLILHNGRNIWPQDIEWAAEHIEPLKDGDVAAFAVEGDDGDDDVVVLLQCRLNAAEEMEALRRKVGAAVHQAAGVECRIVLVPPKSLPYTSSGKLSRAGATRASYLAGEIAEIAPEAPAASSGPKSGSKRPSEGKSMTKTHRDHGRDRIRRQDAVRRGAARAASRAFGALARDPAKLGGIESMKGDLGTSRSTRTLMAGADMAVHIAGAIVGAIARRLLRNQRGRNP